jgi:hypothetical protein
MKTPEERKAIVDDVRTKMATLGLSPEFQSIQKLEGILEDYEHRGIGSSGTIEFPEAGRSIQYVLPMRACNKAVVCLKTSRMDTPRPGARRLSNHQKKIIEERSKGV